MSYTGGPPSPSGSDPDLTDTEPTTPSQSPPLTEMEPSTPVQSPVAAAAPPMWHDVRAAAAAPAAGDPRAAADPTSDPAPLNFEPRASSGDVPVLRHFPAGAGALPRPRPAAPHRQGDQPPDDCLYFSAFEFADVLNWSGVTFKRVPGPCKDLLRDLGNEAAHAAATGDHDSIKALIMFARMVMFVPIKNKIQTYHHHPGAVASLAEG